MEQGAPKLTLSGTAKMWPVGWEALGQWGDDVARIEPLAGGVANEVWTVHVDGQLTRQYSLCNDPREAMSSAAQS